MLALEFLFGRGKKGKKPKVLSTYEVGLLFDPLLHLEQRQSADISLAANPHGLSSVCLLLHPCLRAHDTVSSWRGFLDLHQQNALAWIPQSVHEMHKSVSGLQSVESDTGPGCEIIFPDLVIADFESAVMKNQQNHGYAESSEDICMAATAAGRSNRQAFGTN